MEKWRMLIGYKASERMRMGDEMAALQGRRRIAQDAGTGWITGTKGFGNDDRREPISLQESERVDNEFLLLRIRIDAVL